jgi:hypothetical protein
MSLERQWVSTAGARRWAEGAAAVGREVGLVASDWSNGPTGLRRAPRRPASETGCGCPEQQQDQSARRRESTSPAPRGRNPETEQDSGRTDRPMNLNMEPPSAGYCVSQGAAR